MSAMLSGVIIAVAFGLAAVLGLALVTALFLMTRRPAGGSPRGSADGD